MKTILLTAVAALTVTAAPAAAIEPWSASRTLQGATKDSPEAATRIAVDATGRSVVAWVDATSHIRVSSGDRHGAYGRVKTFGSGLRPTVAIAPNGSAVVLWARGGALYEAYRPSATARFQAARRITPSHARDGDDFPQAVARPNGRFVVVYDNAYRTTTYHERLRTLDLVRGAPTAVVELGPGQIGRGMPVRVSPQGAVTVCCAASGTSTPARAILVRAAGASAFTPLPVADAINGAAVAPDGTVAVGATKVTRGGEAITIGVPEALRGDDTLLAPLASSHPAFGGDVAYDARGRLYLFWQQKTRSTPFSDAAPLYAAIAHAATARSAGVSSSTCAR